MELAVRYGEPLFSANVTHSVEPYQELVEYYRAQWVAAGHRPEDALVGAGSAGFLLRPTSQEAKALFRPIFEARHGDSKIWASYEDFLQRSSALVGSPAEISDKIHSYHEALGHEVMHLSADGDGLTPRQHREGLELFQAEVAPELRLTIPSRPLDANVSQLQSQG